MEEMILSLVNQFGYFGIAFLIALENIFPPIPSEVILTFGGFMTTYTKMSILGVVVASTIGSIVGSFILYGVGKLLNKERLEKWVNSKVGKLLHLKKKNIEKADQWFDTKGSYTVFFCRFVPIVRSLISIPAGMSEMAVGKFLLLTILGTAIWNTVLVWLGSIMGSTWPKIVKIMNSYSVIALIIIILIIVVGNIIYRKQLGNKKK